MDLADLEQKEASKQVQSPSRVVSNPFKEQLTGEGYPIFVAHHFQTKIALYSLTRFYFNKLTWVKMALQAKWIVGAIASTLLAVLLIAGRCMR